MTAPKLDRRILKSVSRSFYLSIRVLPSAVETPIGIAYLLARASDTIADTATVPLESRIERLAEFEALICGQASESSVLAIQKDIQPTHRGERALITALPQLLDTATHLPAQDWTEIRVLMRNIIRGQSNDLKTFSSATGVIPLPNAAALEEYAYLVAGCVGEFWTRVCFQHLPNYSRVSEADLMPFAANLGKALQLVNILRDLPTDLAAGRCYLPADELSANGVEPKDILSHPNLAQPVVDAWIARARELLDSARIYISSVRIRRIQLACYLPWRLAIRTLDLLQQRSPIASTERLKVPRSAVRAALWEGLRVAFFNKSLPR